MNNMEQPNNQNLQMEETNEKLHNVSTESSTYETDRDDKKPISQNLNGSINLGKFKDAESLLKAYNSLQTEFTKKSQRLSELENSKTEFTREEKINQALKELSDNHNIAQRFAEQIKQNIREVDTDNYLLVAKDELLKELSTSYKSAQEYIEDEQFLNQYVYNNPNIRDNIMRDYLTNLTNSNPTRVMSNISSSIPVSPPNHPTTIQDAGRLAKNIIKQI